VIEPERPTSNASLGASPNTLPEAISDPANSVHKFSGERSRRIELRDIPGKSDEVFRVHLVWQVASLQGRVKRIKKSVSPQRIDVFLNGSKKPKAIRT
jgi:hypothetical protein